RVAENDDSKRWTQSKPVSSATKYEGADGAHRESQHHRHCNRRNLRVEFSRDVAEHEHHQEEIESIQHPAEIRSRDDALLFPCPALKRLDCHASPPRVEPTLEPIVP